MATEYRKTSPKCGWALPTIVAILGPLMVASGCGPRKSAAEQAYDKGVIHIENGEPDQAIPYFEKVVEYKPGDISVARAYYNLGIIYQQKGEHDRAISYFTDAIRLNPSDDLAYHDRGVAYGKKGELDLAIADLTKAIDHNPQDAIALNNRGLAYLKKDDRDKAIDDFTASIRCNPDDSGPYVNRGAAYQGEGHIKWAIADYNTAIKLRPNDTLAYLNRGIAHEEQDSHSEAISDYKEAIRLDSTLADAHIGLAWLRATSFDKNVRDGAESVEHAKKACAISGRKDWRFLDTLAAAYAEADDYVNAAKTQQEAIKLAPVEEHTDLTSRLMRSERGHPYRVEPKKPNIKQL